MSVDDLVANKPDLASERVCLNGAVRMICSAFERGAKLFIAGNGGSMSDALHISGELLKAFRIERRGFCESTLGLQPGVPVWVLGNNPSLASAVDNDFEAQGLVFAQELFAAGCEGDVLLGISTSGGAVNIRQAFTAASEMGIATISLTGRPGRPMSDLADLAIKTPGADTAEIQEYHILVYHTLCTCIENLLFGESGSFGGPYRSLYELFDWSEIKSHSILERNNRTEIEGLVAPGSITAAESRNEDIALVARETVQAHRAGLPVVFMMGAHLVKNGLAPLLVDLIECGIVSLIACNGALPIHDMELALCGGTSEKVAENLPVGRFGFAAETGFLINGAYLQAHRRKMGAGQAMGGVIAGDIELGSDGGSGQPADRWGAARWDATRMFNGSRPQFPFKDHSILHSAYRNRVPVTVHATIGTDIVDQHPGADFAAKGYASGVDFSIFVSQVTRMTTGGVVIDIGGAVTQPEVLLKAVSMAANVGRAPKQIVTAVFDLFEADLSAVKDENKPGYYRRDIKSIVVRIPAAFGGRGYYIGGDHRKTFVDFYANVKYLLRN